MVRILLFSHINNLFPNLNKSETVMPALTKKASLSLLKTWLKEVEMGLDRHIYVNRHSVAPNSLVSNHAKVHLSIMEKMITMNPWIWYIILTIHLTIKYLITLQINTKLQVSWNSWGKPKKWIKTWDIGNTRQIHL